MGSYGLGVSIIGYPLCALNLLLGSIIHSLSHRRKFASMSLRVLARDGGCVRCGWVKHTVCVGKNGRYEKFLNGKNFVTLCLDCRQLFLEGKFVFDKKRNLLEF